MGANVKRQKDKLNQSADLQAKRKYRKSVRKQIAGKVPVVSEDFINFMNFKDF